MHCALEWIVSTLFMLGFVVGGCVLMAAMTAFWFYVWGPLWSKVLGAIGTWLDSRPQTRYVKWVLDNAILLVPAAIALSLLLLFGIAVSGYHAEKYGCAECHPSWLPGDCPLEEK
jgi:hypothetical protein